MCSSVYLNDVAQYMYTFNSFFLYLFPQSIEYYYSAFSLIDTKLNKNITNKLWQKLQYLIMELCSKIYKNLQIMLKFFSHFISLYLILLLTNFY